MQTFLPYESFVSSAQVLDRQRLGKQRLEAWQIYNTLQQGGGWKHHPAVRMWRGYEKALLMYGADICTEWRARGYKDTLGNRFTVALALWSEPYVAPVWLGDPQFHLSHQSNLIRKFPEHYRLYWPGVPDNLPYVWP